jgi:hypothetical protein
MPVPSDEAVHLINQLGRVLDDWEHHRETCTDCLALRSCEKGGQFQQDARDLNARLG